MAKVDIPPETLAKADPELRRALAHISPGSILPVIVTLEFAALPAPAKADDRVRWARDLEAMFVAETADLVRDLEAHGARSLRMLWISRSLSGELPIEAINAAARRPEVVHSALVVPRNIML